VDERWQRLGFTIATRLDADFSLETTMMKNVLILGVFAALGWLLIAGPQQTTAPTAQSSAAPAVAAATWATSSATADRGVVPEASQAPVPVVRTLRALPAPASLPDVPEPDPEAQAQDNLDKRAAKAAIEADGYKRVNVLGKGAEGSWRATAYRGSTEVQLTVDGTGRVTLD
jgi:hypothetical protein